MSAVALKFLRKQEWSTGNGQCEACEGCSPRGGFVSEFVGHERRCKLAKSIEALGGKVEWKRKNTSKHYKAVLKFFAPFEKDYYERLRKILLKL